MNTRQRQSGMSIPGILVIMIMVGFFVMNAIRMAPPYFEYLSVKDIIRRIATDYEADKASVREIRVKIANVFNSNQIYELEPKDVDTITPFNLSQLKEGEFVAVAQLLDERSMAALRSQFALGRASTFPSPCKCVQLHNRAAHHMTCHAEQRQVAMLLMVWS